jgi:hypothetical protein
LCLIPLASSIDMVWQWQEATLQRVLPNQGTAAAGYFWHYAATFK